MSKKSTFSKSQKLVTRIAVPALLVLSFGGMVGYSLMTFSDVIDGFLHPAVSFDSSAPVVVSAKQTAEAIENEGIVLMKNDGVLPIKDSAPKANLFGRFSVDPIYGGSGSGSGSASDNVPLYGYKMQTVNRATSYVLDAEGNPVVSSALENRGFTINPTLAKMYYNAVTGSNGLAAIKKATIAMDNPANSHYEIGEVPVNDTYYSSDVTSSLTAYNDYSLVVIGRGGGEGGDLSTDTSAWDPNAKPGQHQLQLNKDEKDMIALAKQTSKKVIVLINSSNAMELGDLAKDDGIDAIVWIGSIGSMGSFAVADVLKGTVNPSGRTADTWASTFFDMPSSVNMGNNEYTENGAVSTTTKTTSKGQKTWNNSCVDYEEGIYVGYKYYETRYETVLDGTNTEGVKSGANWNYDNEVVYPFGYGLSYSTFEWSDFDVTVNDDTITATMNVKNTSLTPGKDVVEIYFQSPYTDYDKTNKVEKASVNLAGMAKTGLLRFNQTQKVSVEFRLSDMASYDYTKAKTYLLEGGDYYVAAGHNAHDALNNILEKKAGLADKVNGNGTLSMNYNVPSTSTIKSPYTGKEVTNEFDSAYSDKDADGKNIVNYLSRSDWEGTYPVKRTSAQLEISAAVKNGLGIASGVGEGNTVESGVTYNYPSGVTTTSLTATDMIGKSYDDPSWDTLLNQMSMDEMVNLVTSGRYGTSAVDSIGLKAGLDYDGPASVNQNNISTGSGCYYPSEVVMASTWNQNLMKDFGKAIGSESLIYGVGGWYAPAMNNHRTPWAGRNFEYYSEDGVLGGLIGASAIAGANSMGVVTFTKHFAFNDQETNRVRTMAVWTNEQAAREIYLKPFEYAVGKGGSKAMMTSFAHIGTDWVGANKGLMTNVLRNEWGFKGFTLTDMYGGGVSYSYMDHDLGIRAGNDCWLESPTNTNKPLVDNDTGKYYVRQAAKHIIYSKINSSLYYSDETKFNLVDSFAMNASKSYFGLSYDASKDVLSNTTEKVSFTEYSYQYYYYRVVTKGSTVDSEIALYNHYKTIHDAK